MIKLGEIQTLYVIKQTDFGVYLAEKDSSLDDERVLLPKNQIPEGANMSDPIEVFIYKDSEDRIIATTTTPYVTLSKIATLNVIEVSPIGAFLDWGLKKDLLLPFKEQTIKVHQGDNIPVCLYIDKSERLCATMKLYPFLSTDSPYKKDDLVSATIYEIIDSFGAFAVVDNMYSGLIPTNELFQKLRPGDKVDVRIINVKEDGKLTFSLRAPSHIQLSEDATIIYEKLIEYCGFLPFTDKSDPERIKQVFSMSKNAFKRAVGNLLKSKKIILKDDGIYQSENE